MKKLFAVTLMLSMVLTGCGSKDEPKDETATIKIGVEANFVDYFTEVTNAYAEKNEGVKFEIVETPMFDLLDALEAQKGNSADIFMVPNDRIGDLAQKKLIAANNADLSGYTETAQGASKFEGNQYMLPLSTDTTLLFYNKTLTDTVPATLKEIDPAIWSAKYTDFYITAGMFYANGGYIFGDSVTDLGLSNEASIKAGEAIQSLYNSKAPHWEALKEEAAGYEQQCADFMAGKLTYVIDGPWKVADFTNVENGGLNPEDLGVAVIPSWDGSNDYRPLAGTKGITVNAYSSVKDEAIAFVESLANGADATKWFEMTKEVNPNTEVQYEDGSLAKTILDATSQATAMPVNPEFGKVWVPMADALKQIANGGDVETALEAATDIIAQDIAAMSE